MLQLHIDRLRGVDRYPLWTYDADGSPISRREIGPDEIPENTTDRTLVPGPATYSINWQTSVDHDIETRYPIGNASFLSPGTNEWGFWLSNSSDTFDATTMPAVYTDGRQGWTLVVGHLRAGVGRYDGPAR